MASAIAGIIILGPVGAQQGGGGQGGSSIYVNGTKVIVQDSNVTDFCQSDTTTCTTIGGSPVETDPIVGAITGIIKADGATNISAAVDGTDYLSPTTGIPDFDYVQTIFLGKQGNDANDGLSPDKAVLTPTEAITKATALSPADGNRIAISCTDAGEYTDAVIIIPSYIGFNCPNATFSPVGANNVFQIAEESTLIAHKIIQDGGGPVAVVGANTTGKRYVNADTIQATGSGTAIINFAVSTLGLLYVDVRNIMVETGVGVSDNSAGGETHLDVGDIYITGNGGTAIFNGGAGNIFGSIDEIEEIGSPTGTIGLNVDAGKVRTFVGELECDTAYDVESGAELHLSALDLSGTELNDGTLTYYMDGDISGNAASVTSFAPASGSLTLAGADAVTITTTAATGVTLPSTGTLLANVLEDTTPDLGGELDAGAHSIGFTQQTATGDGTTTIDWGLGNKFYFTFGAQAETFTFTAPANPANFMLMMKQDGTGSRTATWPATVMWPAGTAPTLTITGSGVDACSFYWDGTNYFGQCSLAFAVPA